MQICLWKNSSGSFPLPLSRLLEEERLEWFAKQNGEEKMWPLNK